MDLKQRALRVAEEVTRKFKEEFGFEPIIGGSLSLILHGFKLPRYNKKSISFNDIDLLVYPCEYATFSATTVHTVANNVVSERKCNILSEYVKGLRSELYIFNENIDFGMAPHFMWIGEAKVANPMHSLYAKAGYVLEEIGEVASSPEYQKKKISRIEKHFEDIKNANFDLVWHVPERVKLVKSHAIQRIVYNYIETHERVLRTQFF